MPNVQHHHLLLNKQSGIPIPLQQVCMALDMGLGTNINMTPLALQFPTSNDLQTLQCYFTCLHGACFFAAYVASKQSSYSTLPEHLQPKLLHLQTKCTDPMLNCNVCRRVMAPT